ncbi:hypothetical protein ABZ532_06110 [Streptomyces sp. NPDC019396]|uniref:hypothetical protein n=1 Tax=Streptomyces sp. NPDC019396 TaxID=3154687 RepID=UPI0033D3F14F
MTPEVALLLGRCGLVLYGLEDGGCRIRLAGGRYAGPDVGRVGGGAGAWSAWARRHDGRQVLIATDLPSRNAAVCAVADHAEWEDLAQVRPAGTSRGTKRRYPMTSMKRRHLWGLAREARRALEAGELTHTVQLYLNRPVYGKRAVRRVDRGVDEAIRAVESSGWKCCGVEPWLGTGALLSFVRAD